jgi:predicted TIM-barrel fold metal-dependent hydrolase
MQSTSGRGKVLFGTNYPMISHEHALADLGVLGLDDEALALFCTENAKRVFGLA